MSGHVTFEGADGTTDPTLASDEGAIYYKNDAPFSRVGSNTPVPLTGVSGPGSSTDEGVVRFDGTTGALLQDSNVTIDDSGNLSTPGTVDGRDVSVDGTKLDGIASGAEVNPDVVPQAEAEAGTATTERIWTAQRVAQAIDAQAVTGPGSSTDDAIARYDGTTGRLIQNSTVTVDDSGNIATSGTVDGRDLSVDGTKLDGIAAGAEVNPDVVSQAEAEAGTATIERIWTAERVAQAIAALGSGSNVIESEHFLGSAIDEDEIGKLGWGTVGTGSGNALASIQVAGRPGIIRIEPGTSAANGRRTVNLGEAQVENLILTAGVGNTLEDEWLVRFTGSISSTDLEGTYSGWAPDSEMTTNGRPQNGVFIAFEPAVSANFQLITIVSGTSTIIDTGQAVSINTWYRVGFVWDPASGGSIQGRINGANAGSASTTNIITTAISPFSKIDGTGGGGTEPTYDIDRWRLIGTQLSND